MELYHFTEMPYPNIPENYENDYGSIRITLPNGVIDPQKASDLFARYIEEHEYCDELGIHIMLNEHHQTPTCMNANISIPAAVLARTTKKVKILLLGYPLPNRNPVHIAEDIAMLDSISGGRILAGFVRGVGTEMHPANSNPTFNRQMFYEAHDIVKMALSSREPFNFEGRFNQFRYVNVWPRSIQEPHPPFWTTGGSNEEHIKWAAENQYTFAAFLTPYHVTEKIFNTYRKFTKEAGHSDSNVINQLALLSLCNVADTEEQARENAKELMWYLQGYVPNHFWTPYGYAPVQEIMKGYRPNNTGSFTSFRTITLEQLEEMGIMISGTPDTVIKKIKYLYERVGGLGHLMLMSQAGFLNSTKTKRSLELLAKEVYPALKELGLNTSGSVSQ